MPSKFITRILGYNQVTFDKNSIYLSAIPMFAIPLEIYTKFILDTTESLGEEFNEVLFEIGKIQTLFAIKKYSSKYNINPLKNDPNFYVEQAVLSGFGSLKIKYLDQQKKEGEAIIYSNLYKIAIEKYNQKTFRDYMFEGAILATAMMILNEKKLEFNTNIKENQQIFSVKKTDKIPNKKYDNYYKKYNLRNLISQSGKKRNILVEKILKVEKNFIKITQDGTSLFNEKIFFKNMGIFVLLTHFMLKINKEKSEVLLKELGKNCSINLTKKFEKLIGKQNVIKYVGKITSLYGFGNFEIKKNNKILYVKCIENPYLQIYSKIVEKSEIPTYFLEGFLIELMKYSFNKRNIKINKVKKNNYEIIFIINLN